MSEEPTEEFEISPTEEARFYEVERRLREAHVSDKTIEIIERGIEKYGRGSVARFEDWLTKRDWEYYDFLEHESPR
jgi:hypothetical protein